MHYSRTLCAFLLSVQPTVGAGYLPHRNDIVRRYCEPATPDANQTDIIAVACNQVATIGFTECSDELTASMSQSAANTCAHSQNLYNDCLIANSGSETACSDAQLGYSMCSNYTMQAYAYCGCYYNDPTNLTTCANAELQNSASPSAPSSPPTSLAAPASAISPIPPIAPISIYPVVTASPVTNMQLPPATPRPPHAFISTLTTPSIITISSPAISLSTCTTTYITTLSYCNDPHCPKTTSTFSTTITTTINAPAIPAPSRVPDIKASLITHDLRYTTTITGLSLTTSSMGTSLAVDTVYIDAAPTVPPYIAPAPLDPAPLVVPERVTQVRASPAETGGAGGGAGGEGGVCVGRLRKRTRTRVLIVGG